MTTLTHRPDKPYIYHRCDRLVQDIQFCPYEDVLGIGHGWGFSSIVVPGLFCVFFVLHFKLHFIIFICLAYSV